MGKRVFVEQSFKVKRTVADGIVNAVERPLANGDVHLDNSGTRSNLGTLTTRSVNGGPTTDDSGPVGYIAVDSTMKLNPPQRNAITGSVTMDGQDRDLDLRQQPTYNQPPSPSSSTDFTATGINCITTSPTTPTTTATTTTATNNDSSPVTIPSSVSQKVGHVMPIHCRTPVTTSMSEILRRSMMAEVQSSTVSKGPGGSAVARLFGTTSTSTLPASPGSRGGRRSLHHSWVRPGRTVFSDAESVPYKTLTSSRAEDAVTTASSDDSHAPNHS